MALILKYLETESLKNQHFMDCKSFYENVANIYIHLPKALK